MAGYGLLSDHFTTDLPTVEFSGKAIFKICEHLAKLQTRRLTVARALTLRAPGHYLHKYKEFVSDITYDVKKRLLIVVMLVQ